jgi:hypothetical protein
MISTPEDVSAPVSLRRVSDIAAGAALIAIPVATGVVKTIAAGWFMVFYFFGLIAFIPLYALVIVIAATGFFSRRAAFAFVGFGRIRAQIAAWVHPLAFLAATAVLGDMADDGYWASPLSIVFGIPFETSWAKAADGQYVTLVMISAAALVWLVVEWILALVARKRFVA